MDPKSVHDGHDPQFERAVAIALEKMKEQPALEPHRPAFPNYNRPPATPAPTGAGNQRNP